MATNIRPVPDEQGRILRWIVIAIVVAGLLIVTTDYVRASSSIAAVEARDTAVPNGVRERAVVAQAVAARPLRQSLTYSAMISGGHTTDDRWLDVLRRLGWRSTPALQTIVTRLVERNDLPGTLDVLDALLRRGQLFNESGAAIRIMETLPEGRVHVVRLLERHPPWRHDYLLMTDELKNRQAALGRLEVLSALQHRGDRLARDEVAPLLPVLIRVGNTPDAWRLWHGFAGSGATVSPLNDPDFRRATNVASDEAMSVPFEWRIATGHGFSAEPYLDGDTPRLGISWDGRGLPIFASQRTSAVPGRYRLGISTPDTASTVDRLLTFRLRCNDGTVINFRPTGRNSRILRYQSSVPTECGFPEFEIAGRLQAGASSHSVSLDRIVLTRLSDAVSRTRRTEKGSRELAGLSPERSAT